MEQYLRENFEVEQKYPSQRASKRFKSIVKVVKNTRRRLRMVTDLFKRDEPHQKLLTVQGTKTSAATAEEHILNIPEDVMQVPAVSAPRRRAMSDTNKSIIPITVCSAHEGSYENARHRISDEDTKKDEDTLALQLTLGLAGVAGSLAIIIPVTVNLLGAIPTKIPPPGAFKVMGVLSGIALLSSVIACILRTTRGIKKDSPYVNLFTWVFLGITLFFVLLAVFYGIGSFLK